MFDYKKSKQWPFIRTLYKFFYTVSFQDFFNYYTTPITTSHIFMKTCEQSLRSSNVSFALQKSFLRTQGFTHSHSTSSTHLVENICNQIKYLVEGNLRSNNTDSSVMDFVRQSIIPTLIKMFFQPSKIEDSIKENFESSNQQFKDITNNFGVKVKSSKNQTFHGKESSQKFCETAKSDFIRNARLEEKQNLEHQEKIDQHNQYLNMSQSSEHLHQQQILTKSLCVSILLLKTLVAKKSFAFQQIRLFGHQKYKKLLSFVNLFKNIHVKKCVNKFYHNKIQKEQQAFIVKIGLQSVKFNEKKRKLSCQVIAKILKIRVRNYLNFFKDNCFSQNKWMHQWIRNAALRSPLTLKTSVWRLKEFLNSQEQRNVVQINVQYQNSDNQQRKLAEPQISQIRSQQEESISSTEFEKMFQDEQADTVYKAERISIEIMAKNKSEKINFFDDLVQQKHNQEDDEYLRTISEDERESLTGFQ